jgi:hypothetical protein
MSSAKQWIRKKDSQVRKLIGPEARKKENNGSL